MHSSVRRVIRRVGRRVHDEMTLRCCVVLRWSVLCNGGVATKIVEEPHKTAQSKVVVGFSRGAR